MPADHPRSTISAANSEEPSSASALVLAAGCIGAAILMLVFVIQAYWAVSDAGPHFRPQLPPLVVGALTISTTLGAAVLLLTRIAVLPILLLLAGLCIIVASEQPSGQTAP